MKTVLAAVLFLATAITAVSGAESRMIEYYVQLIRGVDGQNAPVVTAKLVGIKLSKRFHSVLAWDSYWEINRQKIIVETGRKTRITLSKERDVEIDLSQPGQRIVTAYERGKAISRITRPIGEGMTITGGDHDARSAWFIVVRRDRPQE